MKAALEYISKVDSNKKIAVLGDVLELGKFSKQMHDKIGEEVVKNQIDVLITVGKEAENISNRAVELGMSSNNVHHFNNNKDAADFIKQIANENDIVLIKASSGMHFDAIVEKLVLKKIEIRSFV